MKINKSLTNCVKFAVWCERHKVSPCTLAGLLTLAKQAFTAGERDCSYPGYTKQRDKAHAAFEEYALLRGFNTAWNGLYPPLVRRGESIYLPDVE